MFEQFHFVYDIKVIFFCEKKRELYWWEGVWARIWAVSGPLGREGKWARSFLAHGRRRRERLESLF